MSKSKTTYTVKSGGVDVTTKSTKAAAIKAAEAHETTHEVIVVTSSGTVVHTIKRSADRAKPRTHVDTRELALGEGVKLPKGYVVAYTRVRIGVAVLRGTTPKDYLVFNLATGKSTPAKGTSEARIITSKLAVAHKDAQVKAAAKAKESIKTAA